MTTCFHGGLFENSKPALGSRLSNTLSVLKSVPEGSMRENLLHLLSDHRLQQGMPLPIHAQTVYPYIMSENTDSPHQATANDVAQWMLATIEERGELSQNNAFYEINKLFGRSFTIISNGGSPSISRSVLTAFRKISDDLVIWERGDKKWRKREFYDAPGRQQY